MPDPSFPGVMPGFDAAAHLAAIVDSADDAIIGKRLDGTIVSWNAGATRLFGFEAQAMIGQPVMRLIPDERLAEEGLILERIRRGERVPDFETLRRCRDGGCIEVSVCVSPIRDAAGRVVGASKIARDIRRHVQMRDQAQQYRDLVETALDAVVAIDGNQRICLFNPAAEAMFGWAAAEILGQPVDRLLPEGLRAAHRQHVADFAAGDGSSRRMGAVRVGSGSGSGARRVNGLRADGSVFPVEAAISRFGQGEAMRMTVVLRDITDTQRAAALRNAAAMAQAANEAKSAFIARMTHELRTPLNAVLGFAHLLLDDTQGVHETTHRRHTQHIYSAGRHLLSLIDDLLDLARIEAGQMRVSAQHVALDALVLDVQSVLEPIARTSGISLQAVPPPAEHALACRADPLRLRQVLYNLVANAIKYNRQQGRVHIEVKPHGAQQVEICISDTGEGLTEEELQHLFEPFNRLGRERSGTPGTGLGLVVVRQLVALMQGELSISSQPGQGTRACLTLPLAGPDDARPATGPAGAATDEAPLSGRVLCIEDHPVNRLLIESILGGLPDVQLLLVPDGQSGLDLLPGFKPDLVLLDMNLPDMSGLDWLAAVRADPALAHTRVAIASASMRANDAADARALGIEGLLSKPLEVGPFLRQVRHWLSQARAARPVASKDTPPAR